MKAGGYVVIGLIVIFGVIMGAPKICHGSRDVTMEFYKMELARMALQVMANPDAITKKVPPVTMPPKPNYQRQQAQSPPPPSQPF